MEINDQSKSRRWTLNLFAFGFKMITSFAQRKGGSEESSCVLLLRYLIDALEKAKIWFKYGQLPASFS